MDEMKQIKALKVENSRLLRALDMMAMALNSHGHQWTPEEQQAYEKVARVNKLNPNLDTPTNELEVSIRVANALRREDLKYIGDLVQITEQEMRRIPNFGNKSLNELKEILHPLGLHFGMHIPHWGPKKELRPNWWPVGKPWPPEEPEETTKPPSDALDLLKLELERTPRPLGLVMNEPDVDRRVLRVMEMVFGVPKGELGKFIDNPGKGRSAVLNKIYNTKHIEAYLDATIHSEVLRCLRSILTTKTLNARVEEAIAELDRGRE